MKFFTRDGGFSDSGGGLSFMPLPHTMQNWHDQWTQAAINDKYYAQLPNVSIVIDVFAKSYYSLLLSVFSSTDDTKATNALSSAGGGGSYSQVSSDAGDENRRKPGRVPAPRVTKVHSGV
jgi:hypothetical protein